MSYEQELGIESESEDGGVPLPTSSVGDILGTVELDPPLHAPFPEGVENFAVVDTAPTFLEQHVEPFFQTISHTSLPGSGEPGASVAPFGAGPGNEDDNINPWFQAEELADAVQAALGENEAFETEVTPSATPSLTTGDVNSGETLPTEPDLFGDLDYDNADFQAGLHSDLTFHEGERVPKLSHAFDPVPDADNDGHYAADRLNCSVETFFTFWRQMWSQQKPIYPRISAMADCRGPNQRPKIITPREMAKAKCDFQGIYWSRYQVTKEQAREVRRMSYKNHVNMNREIEQQRKDLGEAAYKVNFKSESSPAMPNSENYFRFRETNTKYLTSFRHYQLRHNIFAASQNAVYYNKGGSNCPYLDPATNMLHSYRNFSIMCYNPQSDSEDTVMNPSKIKDKNAPVLDKISTLSADHGILVVGSMSGVYGMKSLTTTNATPITVGVIAPADEGTMTDNSTNHIHTVLSRQSGLPQAVFNSNDYYIRILDCTTNKWVKKQVFNSPVNCSVTDPSGRLRLLVSDDPWPVLADAETGEQLARLPGHTDHGFACAWAPDGITMATGHQDGIVQVWDARQLKEAVARIPAEQSGVRAMQFSPLGSGKPVLVLAEPADFVHVVDADTWGNKQTIDFFGEVAGITITPDGRSLYVANADVGFGGMMEFERTGLQSESGWQKARRRLVRADLGEVMDPVYGDNEGRKASVREDWRRKYADWIPPGEMEDNERCFAARGQRWRRHMGLGNIVI